ncbi:MAG: carboxypeptidase-like regulatory domain-containing protein, partial [Phycisphaerales bacterium]|nr:carboxypeptidase-like regulatory domain-containing protein [Phycisphaerales bacterium]
MKVSATCLLPLAVSAVTFYPSDALGQTVAMLRGVVLDPQGGVIPGVDVRLVKSLTALERTTTVGSDGTFQLTNIPLDTYELRVELAGFAPHVRAVDLRTSVPVDLKIVLELAAQSTSVTVTPETPLVDTSSAGTRNQVSMAQIEQMPAPVGSRGIESILVSFPGFAQNANGAIHPRGAHNQMTFVVDGLPISDQLTGAFANALDAGIVQAAELMTGNVPAEFGSKVSGVAVITSRSGFGIARRLAGDVILSAAGFNTWNGAAQMGGDRGRLGYFGSVTAMRTDRFLDQVSRDNLHNAGRFGRGFGRVDLQASDRDMLRFQWMGGRSHFEVANLRSQQAAGQDQRQMLSDGAAWISYLRTLDSTATFESTVGYRATGARLDPSKGDTPVTAAQERRLSTLTAVGRYT